MSKEKDNLQAANEMLEETKSKIQKAADKNFYDIIQISLADKEGKVIGKVSMKYADLLTMTRLHAEDASSVVGMLFHALESDTKEKIKNDAKNQD